MLTLGLPSGVVVSTITSQEESRWFESTTRGPFCVESACSPLWPHSKDE